MPDPASGTILRERHAPRRRGRPVGPRRAAAVAIVAAIAPFTGATLTSLRVVDWFWAAAIAGAFAFVAATAKRGPLLVAAGLTFVTAWNIPAAMAGLVAAGAAASSTRHLRRRAVFARGLSGGACAVSLMAASGSRPVGLIAAAWISVVGLVLASGIIHAPSPLRRRIALASVAVAAVALLGVLTALLGAATTRNQVDDALASLRFGLSLARQGDAEGAAIELGAAGDAFDEARSDMRLWGAIGRLVPAASQNVQAIDGVLGKVSAATAEAARSAQETNVDALTVSGGVVDLAAVAALEDPLRSLGARLDELLGELARWRDQPLVPPLDDRIDRLAAVTRRASADTDLAAHAAHSIPALLGADRPRRYLVLFTSPAEARGRFGFPGSFAEIVITNGKLELLEHGSVTEAMSDFTFDQSQFPLDDIGVDAYTAYDATTEFRSVTLPPDFETAARLAAEMWRQTGRAPVDGVLRFDPASLAALMRFTGPVLVESVGQPLTADNVERFLLFDQYVQFPNEQAPRRELLETVSEVTFERLVNADLPSPRVLAALFSPLVRADHIHAVSFEPDHNDFLARIGLDGGFPAPAVDGLLVTSINTAGNKIDTFLERAVSYRAQVDPESGQTTGTVVVTLTNHAPPGGLPAYVIGSPVRPQPPLGTNRTVLLVYASLPAVDATREGVPVAVASTYLGDRYLHQISLELPPGGTAAVELRLDGTLPMEADEPYSLELRPGGGVTPDRFDVAVTTGEQPLARFDGVVTETVVIDD